MASGRLVKFVVIMVCWLSAFESGALQTRGPVSAQLEKTSGLEGRLTVCSTASGVLYFGVPQFQRYRNMNLVKSVKCKKSRNKMIGGGFSFYGPERGSDVTVKHSESKMLPGSNVRSKKLPILESNI